MLRRFSGQEGRRRVIECLQRQRIINGKEQIATAFAEVVELSYIESGQVLIQQDAADSDLYFVLSGRLAVQVNGRDVAVRGPGQHIGEMALIDTSARRAASVVAIEPSVVAAVKEEVFSELALKDPTLWRLISIELCERLRQRNLLVAPVNSKPVMFIGSSRESLPIASELRSGLQTDHLSVRLWSDGGVFGPSRFPIEDLAEQVKSSDFTVMVLGPDDRVVSRGRESDAPRDNVVFELGLFMGALSRQRAFIVVPRGMANRHSGHDTSRVRN